MKQLLEISAEVVRGFSNQHTGSKEGCVTTMGVRGVIHEYYIEIYEW